LKQQLALHYGNAKSGCRPSKLSRDSVSQPPQSGWVFWGTEPDDLGSKFCATRLRNERNWAGEVREHSCVTIQRQELAVAVTVRPLPGVHHMLREFVCD
jgi:hypothetical protein